MKRLPTINPYPFRIIQPLNGSSAATCPPLSFDRLDSSGNGPTNTGALF